MYTTEALFRAICDNDEAKVKGIVHEVNVNAPSDAGGLPLVIAVMNSTIGIVKVLIDAGAHVDGVDGQMQSPLVAAVVTGRLDVVTLLLSSGAQVDLWPGMSFGEYNAVMWAAYLGRDEILSVLLKHGAAPISRLPNGISALQLAETQGRKAAADLLRQVGCTLGGEEEISIAIQRNDLTQLDKLLRAYHSKVVTSRALAQAIKPGVTDALVALLISKGADVNYVLEESGPIRSATALILSAYFSLPSIVSILLAAGADINAADHYDKTAFMRAIEHGSIEVGEILFKAGARATPTYSLIYWAQRGDVGMVQNLIESGIDINAEDGGQQCSWQGSALSWASVCGHSEVVKVLLKAGASGIEKACHLATISGYEDIVSLLMNARPTVCPLPKLCH